MASPGVAFFGDFSLDTEAPTNHQVYLTFCRFRALIKNYFSILWVLLLKHKIVLFSGLVWCAQKDFVCCLYIVWVLYTYRGVS